jgi:hypothetical protein
MFTKPETTVEASRKVVNQPSFKGRIIKKFEDSNITKMIDSNGHVMYTNKKPVQPKMKSAPWWFNLDRDTLEVSRRVPI